MLTMSVALLIIAVFAGVFGFIAAGPAGLILFTVFFGLIWSVARDRLGRSGKEPPRAEPDGPMQARRPGTPRRPGGRRNDDPPTASHRS